MAELESSPDGRPCGGRAPFSCSVEMAGIHCEAYFVNEASFALRFSDMCDEARMVCGRAHRETWV